ncbi:hypothetical protein Bca52824_027161 [Brassica carinata]|uniref:Transcription elongation factor Eaf N-terminal domain-containing protein n=1 Tax=Brassica carinata TaxID=52824 RepID=A0A8X7SJ69_BRACI|nr:hypothetical protein Bca52824_027161 [Brassica carinata]
MKMNNQKEEPSIAPEPNRWYNITLGPSLLSDGHSYHYPRFCTLRCKFKPFQFSLWIDKTKPAMFRKRNDNIVTLEFQNNQIGKPKVRFDGVCEADYNDKDAILFFDGETFRLEKLHRAVKRLKYMRVPEATTMVILPFTNTVKPVNETEIDINNPISLGYVCSVWKLAACCPPHVIDHENEEDPNRMGQESARKETTSTKEFRNGGLDIDINLPHPAEMEDDEIAVVDINDDESYKESYMLMMLKRLAYCSKKWWRSGFFASAPMLLAMFSFVF